jgi:molecular chaperone DnaK (HSP70)
MNPFIQFLIEKAGEGAKGKSFRVLGIDLGTTNSTVAEIVWTPGQTGSPQVRCLQVEQETEEGLYTHVLVPSVVAHCGGRVLVGEGAKRLRTRASERKLEQGRDLFWDCKNDMGLKRTYHRAAQGLRSAREIGGQVLRFLNKAIRADNDTPTDRVVVTVPASFQTAQRRDTLEAGRLAGLELVSGDLVDEPVAAFLDYGFTYGLDGLGAPGEKKQLVVFDFGGGTCDVAVFGLRLPRPGEALEIAPLAVSRYHRLGGGDIDAGIVYDVLLPQIREQNQLAEFALSFEDKKQVIEPAFLGLAEALKISLCKEISRLEKFGRYRDADPNTITVRQPGAHECRLRDGRTLRLQSPVLTAAQFLRVLEPFLDRDVLCARETEYRMTCSVFGPLSDGLDRSGLNRTDVDLCLLVGGSSLIPPVQDAVRDYFPRARLLTYPDADAVQTAVARGGAYHALMLAATDHGILQPIAGDAIKIQTQDSPVDLIPAGARLPYPAGRERWAENRSLAVPKTSTEQPVELRLELINGSDVCLARFMWRIPPPVRQGDQLVLRYRLDENQILEMTLHLPSAANQASFEVTVENPLTNVLNPQAERQEIDDLEEALRTKRIARTGWADALARLADLYDKLGHRERALDLLRKAVSAHGRPDTYLLNKMGLMCDWLRDYERAEKFYREGAALDDTDGTCLFNLSLSQKRRGVLPEARATLDEAIKRARLAPYLVLRAQLCDVLKEGAHRGTLLAEAFSLFGGPRSLTEWELFWFAEAARMRGHATVLAEAEQEQKRRKGEKITVDVGESVLPRRHTTPEGE